AGEVLEMAEGEGCAGWGIEHFKRHMPERVLAECAAKRRIVELHQDGNADLRWDGDPDPLPGFCTVCHNRSEHEQERWPCLTLRLLAAPYAEHPDAGWAV